MKTTATKYEADGIEYKPARSTKFWGKAAEMVQVEISSLIFTLTSGRREESMEIGRRDVKSGLVEMPIVSAKNQIEDGRHRIWALQEAGKKTVWVLRKKGRR